MLEIKANYNLTDESNLTNELILGKLYLITVLHLLNKIFIKTA